MPAVRNIGREAFRQCGRLHSVSLPQAKELGNGAFAECSALIYFDAPHATRAGGNEGFSDHPGVFAGCQALERQAAHPSQPARTPDARQKEPEPFGKPDTAARRNAHPVFHQGHRRRAERQGKRIVEQAHPRADARNHEHHRPRHFVVANPDGLSRHSRKGGARTGHHPHAKRTADGVHRIVPPPLLPAPAGKEAFLTEPLAPQHRRTLAERLRRPRHSVLHAVHPR